MHYKIVVAGLIALVIVSCTYTSPIPAVKVANNDLYQDFIKQAKYPEEVLLLQRCIWHGIDDCISFTDFAVVGAIGPISIEPVTMKIIIGDNKGGRRTVDEVVWQKKGEIKGDYLIYGSPPGGKIALEEKEEGEAFFNSGEGKPSYYMFFGCYVPETLPMAIDEALNFDERYDKTLIFLGKKEYTYPIVFPVWTDQEIISPQAIKTIKRLQSLSADAFQKEQQDLWTKSNNSELLNYLFRRCQRYGNISDAVELLRRLSDNNPSMPNRKFLAYGFSLYILHELTNRSGGRIMDFGYINSRGEKFDKAMADRWLINESQKQVLIDIAAGKLSEVTGISEGLKYLRLVGMLVYDPNGGHTAAGNLKWSEEKWQAFNSPAPIDSPLFKKVPALKDNLKAAAQTLSQRFENDKDYPEWQKWVNKIFPETQPSESSPK